MDRFVSHYTLRFDAKGRISTPAPFRAVLAKEGFEGLFLHPALDAAALDCGGKSLLDQIDALLATTPPCSPEREDLATALLGTGENLKFDSEGRMMLSPRLREAAGLADEAVFVGQGYKFQIWSPDGFAAHLEKATSRARALRQRIGAPAPGARA